jgi:tyrosyl-tRNA synthetase
MNFLDELTWRGLLVQASDEQLATRLESGMTLYTGFDPTAPSLHAGSLLPIVTLMRAARAGLRPIALVGGATGMIGDPSGKSEERNLLSADTVEQNVAGLRAQLDRICGAGVVQLVNNADWFRGYGYLDFLRDIGKHFSVNMMLAKESVRARIESVGISYTEFSYMLIQAYDFFWLYKNRQCRLQIGGSDQWGNITLGIELIRRLEHGEAFGVTTPLITDSSGKKFGKTEKGAVWLDPARTSPFDFHQFFLRTDDRDVGKLLRYYTFLDEKRILELEESVRTEPEARAAQHALADEVTTLVHGATAAVEANAAAKELYGGAARAAEPTRIDLSLPLERLQGAGVALVDLLTETQLSSSKSAARRDIEGGGAYLNEKRVESIEARIAESDLRPDGVVILRKGKKHYKVIKFE